MKIIQQKVVYIFVVFVCLLILSCDKTPQGPEEVPEDFGIYSESTQIGVNLDVDSFLGTDFGGGGRFIPTTDSGFVDDINEKMEGDISKRSTINVASSGQWAIWFVQQGLTSSNNETRDMSKYSGGTITFWVKAQPQVQDLLVGIRSGNVLAGNERKVLLSRYGFSANNQWSKVSVLLDDLEGTSPKADLSKIKVFFVVGSGSDDTRGTNGDATFWIDDVRWVAKVQE